VWFFVINALQLEMEDTDAQVLGVLQAVLELKDWAKASEIMDVLEGHGINACFHGGVRKALCQLVHHIIDPIYSPLSPKHTIHLLQASKSSANAEGPDPALSPNATPQLTTSTGVDDALLPILKRLDLHIAYDVLLIVKILRVFKVGEQAPDYTDNGGISMRLISSSPLIVLQQEFTRKGGASSTWDEHTFPKTAYAAILGKHILPSLALIDVNPGMQCVR